MGFFKKYFGLEEEYEEEYYDDEPNVKEERHERQDRQDRQDRYEEPKRPQRGANQNVVSIQSVQNGKHPAKVVLLEPRAYSEVQQIADHLLSKRAVVINLQQVDYEHAKRIVDFLSGTTYAIGGDIKKIGSSTFLCTSDNVDISGQISDLNIDFENSQKRW
ncbi:cell division protein SepF [Priestia taiwanensis]|uniref:Cell division protein SepF n=1 Tax=Priestia taiwanensis TaxID=1347902 RepID=A0A917ENB7_9BACI|nr:cell division protein SepF [Priestia taiwanensis]MBM7362924.1 cell division inhibitor SepF [Priestia taiwanensis]GGE66201.1 cell division protein SepF [Priestia taiwanensis]